MKQFSSYILDEQYLCERVQGQQMQEAALRSFAALRDHYVKVVIEAFTRLRKFYDSEKKRGNDPLITTNQKERIKELFLANSGMPHMFDSNGVIFTFSSNSVRNLSVIPSFIDKSNMSKSVGGSFLMVKLCDRIPSAGGVFCAVRHGCMDATISITMKSGNNPLDSDRLAELSGYILKANSRKASELIRNYKQSIATMFDAYKEIYIHEYTHYLDEIRYKGKPSTAITKSASTYWDKSQEDKSAYYLGENEINARLSEAEGLARAALKDMLVASVSNATAYQALGDLKKQVPNMEAGAVESVFNDARQPIGKTLISRRVERVVMDKLDRMRREESVPIWMGGVRALRDKDPFLTLVVQIAHLTIDGMVWGVWTKNDKVMRKVISRLYGIGRELKKQMKDFIDGVAKGKVPSASEWSRAIERCRHSYNAVAYSGHFMASKSKEVYSPKKTYRISDADFAD